MEKNYKSYLNRFDIHHSLFHNDKKRRKVIETGNTKSFKVMPIFILATAPFYEKQCFNSFTFSCCLYHFNVTQSHIL